MKIVILSDYFDDRGGAVGVARSHAFGLKRQGHGVSVITTVQNKSKEGKKTENSIDIYSIYSDYNLLWRAYYSLYNPQTVKSIAKIIEEIKPDVVHAHNIHTYLSYYALKIAKKSGAKVFLTIHDTMLFHYGKLTEFIDKKKLSCQANFDYKISVWKQIKRAGKTYNPFRNIIIRRYLKYVNKIFAVSKALKKALNDNGIGNVEVVYNGINVEDWQVGDTEVNDFKAKSKLENKPVIFFGSRLGGIKGQELIIPVMKKIKAAVSNPVLLIAGKVNINTQNILHLAEKLGVKENTINCGWLSGKELKAVIHASSAVILPSPYFDSFPLLNLEAMACKKPVIATCFGGSREAVVDGETGYIVNPFNIEVMAGKIIDLLENPDKARVLGEAGYERVKKEFSLEKMINSYLEYYYK